MAKQDSDEPTWLDKPIFLAGATGFIGSALRPKLIADGLQVRCASRSPTKARARWSECEWREFDLDRPATMKPAMEGCGSAFYLVHQMGGGEGYREREREGARAFRRVAEEVGLERIVYLGGVAPSGEPSEHLASRLETGESLRRSGVSTIELRASMIIGPGSASWNILRDLAARLPVMLLPKWTKSRTQPVALEDVLRALREALRRPAGETEWYDIPGPDTLSVSEIFEHTAEQLGHRTRGLSVPLLSPRVSSYWLQFVTRCDRHLATELVLGLANDLLAEDHRFWELIGHADLVGFDEAVRRTLAASPPESLSARVYERLLKFVTPTFSGSSSDERQRRKI